MPMTTSTWDCFWIFRAAAWIRANSSLSWSRGSVTQPVKSPPGPLWVASISAACSKRGFRLVK